jgi:uncharacterized protein (TIGR03437 family)
MFLTLRTLAAGALLAAVQISQPVAWSQTTTPMITSLGQCCGTNQVTPRGGAYLSGSNLADHTGFGAGNVIVLVNGVSAFLRYETQNFTPNSDLLQITIPAQTPVGSATFQVSNNGAMSPVFTAMVSQYAPATFGIYDAGANAIDANHPVSPGSKVILAVTGLGAVYPPPIQLVSVGGFPVATESIQDNVAPLFSIGLYSLLFTVPAQLASGSYPITVTIGGIVSNPTFLPVASTGLSLTQTGVTFQAVAGSSTTLQRNISVISTSTPISWTATASTISGGTWLQVTPAQGISDPAKTAPSITIAGNAANLAAGDYYGTVTIRAPTALQVISVVFHVVTPALSPGAVVEPTGLTFTGSPGGNAPAAKTLQISNPTTAALTFTASLTPSTSPFQIQPLSGMVLPGQAASISVQPSAGLVSGTYPGTITLSFSDGNNRSVGLLAVIAAGATGTIVAPESASSASASAACVPTKLLPVFTLLGVNFTSPVAWPADIEANILDDCGNPMTSGTVVASFSNGDPPLGLMSTQDGRWSVTWTPGSPVNANLVVTLVAQTFTPALAGTTSVSGVAPSNPNVPIVNLGGLVGTASYVASPAPGTLISLFGTALADNLLSATALPLPLQLLSTQVFLGGVNIPLVFVSANQINAEVPYTLPTKTTYSLIVQRGSAISTPQTVAINDGQPGVFTIDQSGSGQGHIYKITSAGAQILAAPGAPVSAGDVVTIYCSGLGQVNPATLIAGAPAPLDVLEYTANPVTATVGGVSAQVLFAGLSPGFTGLYQVNLTIPAGVTPGDTTPLVLSVAGVSSKPVTMAVH